MNLFRREMRKNLKSFIVWLVALSVINVCILAAFEAVAQQAADTELMLSQYPEGFIDMLSLDKLDMTNILHYFASRSYLFITIFGAIYCILLSSGILSKEESERTVEFLISKPLTRTQIITQKLLCTFTYITAFFFIYSVTNYIAMTALKWDDFNMKGFLLASIGPWLIGLFFASIGFLMSVFIVKTKSIFSISIGVVFAGYFFSILATLNENFEFMKYINPFSYYNTEDLVISETIQAVYLVLTIAVVVVCVGLTYYFYNKKDIKA